MGRGNESLIAKFGSHNMNLADFFSHGAMLVFYVHHFPAPNVRKPMARSQAPQVQSLAWGVGGDMLPRENFEILVQFGGIWCVFW